MKSSVFGALALAGLAISMSARAQLKSVDGGLAVEDRSGLIFANTVGTNLSWSASAAAGSAQAWVLALNAERYGGFSDWSLASGDGDVGANTTTDQLGELFYKDCGAVRGSSPTMKGCGSFSSLVSQLQSNQLGIVLFSSSVYRSTPGLWWAFETGISAQTPWSSDTQFGFQVGTGDATAVRKAPELNIAAGTSALALLVGGLIVFRSRPRAVVTA